jgi:hypothetical protein
MPTYATGPNPYTYEVDPNAQTPISAGQSPYGTSPPVMQRRPRGTALNVPSKNIVSATDTAPAVFRPSNQLRLQPAQSTNPATHGGSSFMPSFLDYRGANDTGDMGLGWRRRRHTPSAKGALPVVGATSISAPPSPSPMASPSAPAVRTTGSTTLPTPSVSPAGVGALSPTMIGGLAIGALGLVALAFIMRR